MSSNRFDCKPNSPPKFPPRYMASWALFISSSVISASPTKKHNNLFFSLILVKILTSDQITTCKQKYKSHEFRHFEVESANEVDRKSEVVENRFHFIAFRYKRSRICGSAIFTLNPSANWISFINNRIVGVCRIIERYMQPTHYLAGRINIWRDINMCFSIRLTRFFNLNFSR